MKRFIRRFLRLLIPLILECLEEALQSLANAERMLDADSQLQIRMNSALDEITGAARALRLLLDYLERHPNALLMGKGGKK